MAKIYYDIADDLKKYPNAWCYAIIGGRNTGKTYSALTEFTINRGEPIVFARRTNKEVDVICTGRNARKKALNAECDLSPYKPINRDFNTNIYAYKLQDGIGGFYETDEEGSAVGMPKAWLTSLHAVDDVKGFDLSECEALIFDEYIAKKWQRIDRKEGEQVMELYKTVSRDRVIRGRGELKLILLANAVSLYNPVNDTLEIVDDIAEMTARGEEYRYLEERGILIHLIKTSEEMMRTEEQTGIYRAMKDTSWGAMAFDNDFGYDDLSCVRREALKGYRPVCEIINRKSKWYLYYSDGRAYICRSPAKCSKVYNLNREVEQIAFYYDKVCELYQMAVSDLVSFETYAMYDCIMNYKQRFKV